MSNTFKTLPWPVRHLHEVAGKLSEAIDAAEPLKDFDIGDKPTSDWVNKMREILQVVLHTEGELIVRASKPKKP